MARASSYIIWVDQFYQKNRLFDLSDPVSNRDNVLAFFIELKKTFQQMGIDLNTQDFLLDYDVKGHVICDYRQDFLKVEDKKPRSLLLFESELVKPLAWRNQYHKLFTKIFTWHDPIIDDQKYYKFNFSLDFPSLSHLVASSRNKFCTLIAGNKKSNHPLELYSKRQEAIDWFNKNAPEDFEYFGIGWDYFASTNRIINRLKIPRLGKLKGYGGAVQDKYATLAHYQFCICYENARDIEGYITEKILDCFIAGTIPIYWGANNIDQFIPTNAFIDKKKFATYEELYSYLKSLSNNEINMLQKNGQDFLLSIASGNFQAAKVAYKVGLQILNELK